MKEEYLDILPPQRKTNGNLVSPPQKLLEKRMMRYLVLPLVIHIM
jgi:hypothetical protein